MPHAPARPVATRPAVNGNANGLAAKTARIDLDGGEEETVDRSWEMRENYQDAVEGELNWVVRGKEEDLGKAVAVLESAIEKAKAATHGSPIRCLKRRSLIVLSQLDY